MGVRFHWSCNLAKAVKAWPDQASWAGDHSLPIMLGKRQICANLCKDIDRGYLNGRLLWMTCCKHRFWRIASFVCLLNMPLCHMSNVFQNHIISYHIISYHIISHHCHVMSCHVMSCHVMSCHVMSCREYKFMGAAWCSQAKVEWHRPAWLPHGLRWSLTAR